MVRSSDHTSIKAWVRRPVGSSSDTCLARRYFKPVEHKILMDGYGKSAAMHTMKRPAVVMAAAAWSAVIGAAVGPMP